MRYFEKFLKCWEEKNPGKSENIQTSVLQFVEKLDAAFLHKGHLKGLLLGHVQSGKTSQMLGVISSLADRGIKLFILLTSDMTNLQTQTLQRAFRFLREFNICDETDDMRFKEGGLAGPTLVVLKKNSRVLKSWKSKLLSMAQCKYETMVLLDDEADAASLNTKINQKEVSTINRLLNEIASIPPVSIYIQVTATPQAILLQTKHSGWRPAIVHAFQPGLEYRGGSFFYDENSRCVKPVAECETQILLDSDEIPAGLQEALLSFLMNCIYLTNYCNKDVCNFLVHPGSKINHHSTAERKILRLLKAIKEESNLGSELLRSNLYQTYQDIKSSCPSLPDFDYFWGQLPSTSEKIRLQILNSNTAENLDYETGLNILIGGNSMGRGITFPGLQVVYYCRESKAPQADTLWQHSRIFGYDRISDTCRIFLPPKLLQIFRRLNESNDALFNVLLENDTIDVAILEPEGVIPTRKNVIDQEALIPLVGNTNYYLGSSSHKRTTFIDSLLGGQDKEGEISIEEALKILALIEAEDDSDRQDLNLYLKCLSTLKFAGELTVYLIVRVDRDISKGTGTLLSPNDRQKSNGVTDKTVLTLYRINGQAEKGWSGDPIWIPNIKFPKGKCFYLAC